MEGSDMNSYKRLHVNVDHVATLREARGTSYPDPVTAAMICELSGADGITVHLREDRRHIKERDVELLRKTVKTKLNLEMGLDPEIIEIALKIKPDIVTIVPERRQELTTEGGLNLKANFEKLKDTIPRFKEKGIKVSLFIEPELEIIELAKELSSDIIELHTGRYCEAKDDSEREKELERIKRAASFGKKLKFLVAAGHGLNYENIIPVSRIAEIEEFNIGHSIISRAVIVGIERAVKEMKYLINLGATLR